MKSHFLALMLLAALGAVGAAEPDHPAALPAEPELQVVLVTGEQPGPALWKVSGNFHHTLWILGDVSPLPKKAQWKSREFAKLLGHSQEVILHLSSYWRGNDAQSSALENAGRFRDGHTLKDVLSPELYAQVRSIWEIYGSREKLDDLRPFSVGNRIINGAMSRLDLKAHSVNTTVDRLARKANVKITKFYTPPLEFDDHLKTVRADSVSACLGRVVEILRDGGSGMRQLANAWAIGDIDSLRTLVPAFAFYPNGSPSATCFAAIHGGPQAAEEYEAKQLANWLKEAERALLDNTSTLAVVPITELFAPDGYLAALRARGYEVVEPD
ncbi:MAG TPA: TraB/GumN family protein [Steroidobacteraceae bacterium]|nr:TraB/GumN family protein [Steroidobacteraceae bacterium]